MPTTVTPSGELLGASVEGLDLAHFSESDIDAIVQALGHYGVLRFPRQTLSAAQLKAFASQLGELEINVVNTYQAAGHPEVMILSNIVEYGNPIGLADAGQSWHTDMSYSKTVAFANVLHALRVPQRDGRPLGATEFCDMCAAYDDLPDAIKQKLVGKRALHDFEKFWEMMRARPGNTRPPLTQAQRQARPPVSHPVVITHPINGRTALYANPGYTVRIEQLPRAESDELLEFLFAHQTQDKYRYVFRWTLGDVLVWDNLRVIHQAVADYAPDEHRLMKRCQVMATRFAPL
ncbi:MAG TPA: TauD/TfdA family dioxygenase [Burkholderiales bacterium]|nr:TauD/TfdA family dioxygenase [Burkholderiales bacterium]